MELRLLELIVRIFDPRLWRRRVRQLLGSVGVIGWIWFRAVNRAEVVRAVADVQHGQRQTRIRTENAALEAERLSA